MEFGFMVYQALGSISTKYSLCINIKYISFGWNGFHGISTLLGHLIPNLLDTIIRFVVT